MIQQTTVVRVEIKRDGGKRRIIATDSNGRTFQCGDTPTEKGAHNMLVRRAKQFKLTVSGETAQ